MEQINEQIKSLENLIKADPKNYINYFYLGDVYRKIKKYDFALNNYQKSVELNSKFPEGFNNLANIYRELKDTKNSILFFKKAIELNPNYINAIYNLGIVYFEVEKYDESSNCFKKVLEINPKHLASLNNLGLLFKKTKYYEEALDCFEKVINIDVNFIKAYNNIGTISLELGNIKHAILNYKKVLQLDPNNFISYQNLLAAYENSNKIDSFQKTLNVAEKKFPNAKILKLYKGVLFFRKKKFKESIDYLNSATFNENEEIEIKRIFFLAKAYDHANKVEEAFKFFELGNKLESNRFEAKQFNKNRYLKNIETKKKYFIKKNISKWTKIKSLPSKNNPVFLVGFPRSGTTLLDTILRSHPKIKIVEEKPMVLKMVNKIKNNNLNSLNNIKESEIRSLQDVYFNELKKHINPEDNLKILIDKLPLNIINAGEILRIFPNAKFILSLRHPLDCVLSCFMQDFKLNDAMSNFLNIKDSANLYKDTMELWNQYTTVLNINYVTIKYENLINNFETNIKIILKFLNLNWDKSLLDYRKTAIEREKISTPSYYQVVQPIYKHAEHRWKRYKKYLTNIEQSLNQLIKEYKY